MNKFITIGRLIKDAELRYTKENKEICTFTIAINNSKTETTYLNISTFGAIAQAVNNYVKKGDQILIEGSIKNNNYEDKNGNKHYEYIFIGNKVEFLSSKGNNNKEEKNSNKVSKNELSDEVFAEFGKQVEAAENEIAF